jgi:PAS domain S-box-containing protein
MKSKDKHSNQAGKLRYRAEAITRKKMEQLSATIQTLSPEKIQRLIHELQIHQIELENQNEELLRAQSERDEAREHYLNLYNLAPVGYCTISEKGLILEANLTAATLLGVVRESLVTQPISQFLLKEDQDLFYLHRKQLLRTGEPQILELRMVRNDKTVFWAHLEATITPQNFGITSGYRIILTDITEHKQVRDTLLENAANLREQDTIRRSEQKFRLIFNNANDAIFIHDSQGRMLEVNPLACERLGYSRSEMLSLTVGQIDTPEEIPHIHDRMSHLLKVGQFVFDTVHLRKDGFPIPTEVSARRIVWDDQLAVISICRDLTERNRALQKLQESEKKFQAVFQRSPVGFILLNNQGEILECNQHLTDIFSFQQGENIGLNLLERLPKGRVRQYLANAISEEGVHHYEGPYISIINKKTTLYQRLIGKSSPRPDYSYHYGHN